MKKFLFKSVLLGTILITILSMLESCFDEKALEDKCRRSNWVLSFKDQHFDFAFCGDSRAYNMIHIPTIQDITRLNGINLGYTGTVFEEQYLIVKKFLENGNSIGKLYIQADLLSFDSKKRARHQFRVYNYVPFIGNDTTITKIVGDNTNPLKFLLWKHVPMVKYIEYNMEYPITFLLRDFSDCDTEFDSFGSEMKIGRSRAFTDRINEYVPAIVTSEQSENEKRKKQNPSQLIYNELVSEHTMKYFEQLIRLCKKNRIQVTLYTPPLLNANQDKSGYRKELEKFLGGIATEVDIQYSSFLNDSLCSNDQYFFDSSHTNETGTKAFSKLIANRLIRKNQNIE